MNQLKNITLEVSLKPFKKTDDPYIENVCRIIFTQWNNLIKHAEMVSIMLWASDGTEILEYKGDIEGTFDWSRYIGGVNHTKRWNKEIDPEGIGLHTRSYLYMENPPVFTYKLLKTIVEKLKAVGSEITGKPVRVGATFDPGPEFAKSNFKYKKHNEICLGNTYGSNSFVCCYATFHEDKERYAGFSEGIPEGTPFGTFFGRQCEHFLKDIGFNFLWLSNGFGFGCENWGITGAMFNGDKFKNDGVEAIKEKVLSFWKFFRQECPDIRVETRGTNLATGIDISTDGVPLKDIYNGNFNIMPPPNSPWAAINGDFGLEIAGYMSRVAELPGQDYMFRFYVHDPWWMNSPWIDRYEGQPYDIYMPLAVSRIDENGDVSSPSYINFLTIDNTMGEMPDKCPMEIIPHIVNAMEHSPDDVSPFVWIYPFQEFHEMVSEKIRRSEEVFFGDWFMRGAINNGLPVSTVVSTDNFIESKRSRPGLYSRSVPITPVPTENSTLEKEIIDIVKSGGSVLLYGTLEKAGQELMKLLNLKIVPQLEGEFKLTSQIDLDNPVNTPYPKKVMHDRLLSGGGINTVLKDESNRDTKVRAKLYSQKDERIVSVCYRNKEWGNGKLVWVRGSSSSIYSEGEWLPKTQDPEEYFHTEAFMRIVLSEFGYSFYFKRKTPSVKNPVTLIHKNNNAYFFSGYVPDTTVEIKMCFPLGAPILLGMETELEEGHSLYRMPRAWHSECRVFAEQEVNGTLSCTEIPPVSHCMRRRIKVSGLKNATLRIFPEKGFEQSTQLLLNSIPEDHLTGEYMEYEVKDSLWGTYIEVIKVTGTVMISTPFEAKKAF